MKSTFNTLLMAAAFALPPKMVERSWTTEERQKMFSGAKLVDNWTVEVIDAEPVSNTLITLDKGRDELAWVSANGTTAHHYNLHTRSRHTKTLKGDEKSWAPYQRNAGTKLNVRRGSWELLKNVLYFIPQGGDGNPLWNLPIPDDFVDVRVDRDRSSWLALSTYPNRLYHLFWIPGNRRDEALMEVVKWDEGTELVSWMPCAEGKSLLLENQSSNPLDPKAYVHFLRENEKLRTLEWEGRTEIKGYWATAMQPRTCSEVYLTTTKGVIRAAR